MEATKGSGMEATNGRPRQPPKPSAGAGWAALCASGAAFGIGNSLEPVSACAWAATPLLVHAWEVLGYVYLESTPHAPGLGRFARQTARTALLLAAVAVVQGLGFFVGFSSLFAAEGQTAATALAALGAGVLQWGAVGLLCLVPHHVIRRQFPQSAAAWLVYPSTFVAVTHTAVGRVFSSLPTLAYAMADYGPLRQVAAVAGVGGITWIVTATGTAAALRAPIPGRRRTSNTTLARMGCAFVVLMSMSGLLQQADQLYQKDVSKLIHPAIQASCIAGESYKPASPEADRLWAMTEERLAAGDGIVMWMEEGLQVNGKDEEAGVLARATSLLAPLQHGALLGITYDYTEPAVSYSRNVFVLMQAPGRILWKYFKSHPVPLVEVGVKPGPAIMPTADVRIDGVELRLGGAICFDMDYPEFIVQGGRKGVDLLLQPSWTWRALSSRHLEGNAMRSVENGFAVMRCTSDGESGVTDRDGRIVQRRFTGHETSTFLPFTVYLAKSKGRTIYAAGGYLLEWVFVAAAAVVWGLVLASAAGRLVRGCRDGPPPASGPTGIVRLSDTLLSSEQKALDV